MLSMSKSNLPPSLLIPFVFMIGCGDGSGDSSTGGSDSSTGGSDSSTGGSDSPDPEENGSGSGGNGSGSHGSEVGEGSYEIAESTDPALAPEGQYEGVSYYAMTDIVFSILILDGDREVQLTTMDLSGVSVPEEGTYALEGDAGASKEGVFTASLREYSLGPSYEYTSYSGELVISSSSESEVRGTFHFSAEVLDGDHAGETVAIESGEFVTPPNPDR